MSEAALAAIILGAFALAGCGSVGGTAGYKPVEVYVCGGSAVFAIDAQAASRDPSARTWTWTAADSPQIDVAHRGWFNAMDECKPAMKGSALLVASSSGGGVAIIRRADKTCLFYAGGRNAHSAELIGEDILAGAFSYRSDQLRLYDLNADRMAAKPAWMTRLLGAHGVVWDRGQNVLWTLGEKELLEVKVVRVSGPVGEVLRRFDLPTGGGHDLYPYDEKSLSVTTNAGVYLFDVQTGEFSPMPVLGGKKNVKSVCRHPETGQVIATRGEPIFTNRVHFVGGQTLALPPKDLYKARWNAPSEFGLPAEKE